MINLQYSVHPSKSPILATAIHEGHYVRPEVKNHMAINEFDRLKEEDPYTGYFTDIAENSLIVHTSRFAVDVNRPRDTAIYKSPDQAWGLKVWKENVPEEIWESSLREYDHFYELLKIIIDEIIGFWGYIIILDFHSYNYRRGDRKEEQDPLQNPEINIGTGLMDRQLWTDVIDNLLIDLRDFRYFERHLNVQENIRFRGGYLAKWVHQTYPGKSCVPAIELKKIFMDEHTGAVDLLQIKTFKKAFSDSIFNIYANAENTHKKLNSI